MMIELPTPDYGRLVNYRLPLTRGLDYWYLALPGRMSGTRWVSIGRRPHLGTLTSIAGTPTSTSGWNFRYPRHGGWGALAMDNTNDYVALPAGDLLATSTPFTIAWWEYLFSTAQTFPTRFSLQYNTSSNIYLIFRSSTAGYIALSYGTGGATGKLCSTAPTLANSVGKWVHFVLVGSVGPNSTTNGDFTVYVDGVANSTGTGSSIGTGLSNRFGGYSANFANAAMDDVAIWPARALAAVEARAWYQSSRRGHPAIINRLPGALLGVTAAPAAIVGPLIGGGHIIDGGPLVGPGRLVA
jgi:hypothetical protein